MSPDFKRNSSSESHLASADAAAASSRTKLASQKSARGVKCKGQIQAIENAREHLKVLLDENEKDVLARSWVEQAVTCMWQVPTPIAVKDLAVLLKISERHLMRVVVRLTHKSISEIRREIRMHQARVWVEDEECSISQISRNLGYSTTSGFCRDFRRVFACAPLKWRENHKKAASEKWLK